jgi:hypothetical protein
MLALVGIACASPARPDFFDDVRRTFQKDVPRTFEQDIPRFFGAQPKKPPPAKADVKLPPAAPRR